MLFVLFLFIKGIYSHDILEVVKFVKDEKALKTILKGQPEHLREKNMDPDELVEIGDSFFMVRKYDEAIEAYERAIEAEATYYEAWQHKAEALILAGRINIGENYK